MGLLSKRQSRIIVAAEWVFGECILVDPPICRDGEKLSKTIGAGECGLKPNAGMFANIISAIGIV
jgi:hypothetical protein